MECFICPIKVALYRSFQHVKKILKQLIIMRIFLSVVLLVRKFSYYRFMLGAKIFRNVHFRGKKKMKLTQLHIYLH